MAAGHVGIGLALGRREAEVAPAVDHLLGRATADAELKPTARDKVGRAGVFDHVERVLVAHVDDRGADLDAAGARADGGEQREGRGELRAKWCTRKYEPSAPSSSAATASSIDCSSASCAERVPEPWVGDQWPNDRKPIFFMPASVVAAAAARAGSN